MPGFSEFKEWDQLNDDLIELVDVLRIVTGGLRLVIHEHRLDKVDVSPRYMLKLKRAENDNVDATEQIPPGTEHDQDEKDHQALEELLHSSGVEQFVKEKFENVLVPLVDGFGSLEASVLSPGDIDWWLNIRKRCRLGALVENS